MATDGKIRKDDLVENGAESVYKKLEDSAVKAIKSISKELANLDKQQKKLGLSTKDIIEIEKKRNKQLTEAQKLTKKLKTAKEKLTLTLSKENRELQKVQAATNKVNSSMRSMGNSAKRAAADVGILSKSIRQAASRFIGFTVVSTVIFGLFSALKNTIKRIIEFDKVMVNLAAILNINRSELKDLEDVIKSVAGASIKTSTEVATLAETLVVLGKTKEEIKQLLKPVNELSIGLQATSKEAGELLIMTLNAFGKGTESAQKFADIFANIRVSGALDFQKMRDSLAFLAPVARVAGISFERAGAMLTILVDNSIKASKAGRLTASSFLRLAKQGLSLEQALDQVNDAQRKGIKETELLSLATKLFGVNSGAVGLILASNRDEVDKLTLAYEKSEGVLQRLIDTQLTSLSAKIDILDSAWERFIFSIENGEGRISKSIKGTIISITNLLDQLTRYNKLTEIIGDRSLTVWERFRHSIGLSARSMADLSGQLQFLDIDFKTLEGEGLSILMDAYSKYEERLISVMGKNEDLTKLYQFQLDRINELIKAQRLLDGGGEDRKIEIEISNRRELKDVLADIAEQRKKLLKSTDDEAIAILDIIDLLDEEKEAWERRNKAAKKAKEVIKFLEGTIGWLEQMISKNNLLIKQATDNSTRTKLREENVLLKEQLDKLAKIRVEVENTVKGFLALPKLQDTTLTFFNIEDEKASLEDWLSLADEFNASIGDLFSAISDRRIEAIDAEIVAEEKKFDRLIELAQDDAAQKASLEIERDAKITLLEKKRLKEEQKAAKTRKAFALTDIAINTARGILATTAQLGLPAAIPFNIAVGILGAIQAATVLAQPIPQFAEGGTMSYDGKALINDGGKREYIERGGVIFSTPIKNAVVDLKRKDIVHEDLDHLMNASIMTSLSNDNLDISKLKVIFDNNYANLEGVITKGFNKAKINNNIKLNGFDYAQESYRNSQSRWN